jgi:hypothetical protein
MFNRSDSGYSVAYYFHSYVLIKKLQTFYKAIFFLINNHSQRILDNKVIVLTYYTGTNNTPLTIVFSLELLIRSIDRKRIRTFRMPFQRKTI